MQDTPEIWLVRHGETDWSRQGRHTGRSDVPLNDNGRTQARRLEQLLTGYSFDRVWSSPLVRARETAVLAGFGDRVEIDGNLQEWDYGVYEGRTTDDIRRTEPGFSTWSARITGGESLHQVAERAACVLGGPGFGAGRHLLFAHAHLLRVLAALWMGLEPAAGRLLVLDAGSVSVLGHEHDNRVIRRWNQSLLAAEPHAQRSSLSGLSEHAPAKLVLTTEKTACTTHIR